MNRLFGKRSIVTGGAIGIGRACVERMAGEGAHVAILDLLHDEGRKLADDLEAQGKDVSFWHVDVAVEDALRQAIDAAAAHLGGLDILVNNAGVGGTSKPTDQVTEAEWDLVQAVNVKGVFFATKHAIPHMRRAGGGSIVNLSSVLGMVGQGGIAPYHAAKGAVRMMTKNDAVTYAPDGIRVNSIHPGYIRTPMVEDYLRTAPMGYEAAKAEIAALHPVGHLGEADDIAWAAVYLASDEARFVTGAELAVDGGFTAR